MTSSLSESVVCQPSILTTVVPSLIAKAVMVTHTEKSLTLSAADPNLPVLLLGAFRRQSFIHSIVLAGSYGAQSID